MIETIPTPHFDNIYVIVCIQFSCMLNEVACNHIHMWTLNESLRSKERVMSYKWETSKATLALKGVSKTKSNQKFVLKPLSLKEMQRSTIQSINQIIIFIFSCEKCEKPNICRHPMRQHSPLSCLGTVINQSTDGLISVNFGGF